MITQFDETLLQNLDDFINYYEFTDAEKIYTNGSKLIQVSRIKQWFAYSNEKQKQLEEENERLKAEVDLLNDNRHFLNNKIDKAIEYIEKSINNPQPFYEYIIGDENGNVQNLDKLLKILKGE